MKLLDKDGYPTDNVLFKISRYDVGKDVDGFLALIKSLWSYPDRFCLKDNELDLSTGGWSGNESVIKAMRENFFFYIAHTQWKRGGHYWFDIKAYKGKGKNGKSK